MKFFKKKSNDVEVLIKTHRDKKGGHPHVIMETFENKHVSVGLSSSPTKGKGSKNYRMEKSPFNDGKTSYMRRQGTVDYKTEYENPRRGSITKKDHDQAKLYGERAKKKYFCKKKK